MSAWKACDIRGVYPDEVTPELFEIVGGRITAFLPPKPRVLLAGDFRLSTPALKAALARGLTAAGARVLDAGQVPTPVAYFAHRYWGTDAVLIVTASHNPANHNGLKLMLGHLPPSEEDLQKLQAISKEPPPPGERGRLDQIQPLPPYVDWITERWRHLRAGRPARVVLDAGNGAWADLAPKVFTKLGNEVHPLFCEIDGGFPNRLPDCARPSNLTELSRRTKEAGADLGIAWDGDGDRVAFADSSGEVATADEISLLLARNQLSKRPNEKVVCDIKLSDLVRRTVTEMGGIPLMERSGHTFLKRRMIQEHCLLGCEVSGHYFFRELNGGDDGLFTALLVTDLVMKQAPLAELRRSIPPMFLTPDIRLAAAGLDFQQITERLRKALSPLEEHTIDGLRLRNRDGFVLLRRSVTEPSLTFRIEGFDETALAHLIECCTRAFPELERAMAEQVYEQGAP